MKAIIILIAVMLTANFAYAQNALKLSVKNEETKQLVSGTEVSVNDSEIPPLLTQMAA